MKSTKFKGMNEPLKSSTSISKKHLNTSLCRPDGEVYSPRKSPETPLSKE